MGFLLQLAAFRVDPLRPLCLHLFRCAADQSAAFCFFSLLLLPEALFNLERVIRAEIKGTKSRAWGTSGLREDTGRAGIDRGEEAEGRKISITPGSRRLRKRRLTLPRVTCGRREAVSVLLSQRLHTGEAVWLCCTSLSVHVFLFCLELSPFFSQFRAISVRLDALAHVTR